jgi:hypothetical protein
MLVEFSLLTKKFHSVKNRQAGNELTAGIVQIDRLRKYKFVVPSIFSYF